jgi:hypothetical protein
MEARVQQRSPKACTRTCKRIDKKLHTRWTLRFYARLKIFENGFKVNVAGERIFEFRRSNIFYEINKNNIGTRFHMYHDGNFVKLLLNSGENVVSRFDKIMKDYGVFPQFICAEDGDHTTSALKCWKICLKFIVYISGDTVNYTTVLPNDVNRFTLYVDDRITNISQNKIWHGPCILLPWLDRPDRMLFWKLLRFFQKLNSFEARSFTTIAAISIQEYL